MGGGPSITRKPANQKSNIELVNSLRANLISSRDAFRPSNGACTEACSKSSQPVPYEDWTSRVEGAIYVPSIDLTQAGLSEERSSYDITVKLFFLPTSTKSERCSHTQEAIQLVLKELAVPSIDLLIVSFPGITFDTSGDGDCASSGEAEGLDTMLETWTALENCQIDNTAFRIGVAEFGKERLEKFLPGTKIKPAVDQINLRDACVVPWDLIAYAKGEHIEVLTHNDCTNILPEGTVRELLGPSEKGAGVLAASEGDPDGLKGEVEPQWVVKYTAVVRDRGVIENKGYFAMVELRA